MACLAVHPGQPHMVAVGGEEPAGGGSLLVFDLRQGGGPASSIEVPAGSGAGAAAANGVRDLAFDAAGDGTALAFCTAGGVVGAAWEGRGRARALYREPTAGAQALCLGAAGPLRQLFCATDQEALIYMAGVL